MTLSLRTPKYLTGPDCQIPSLTCEEWFKAKYGSKEWDLIKKIPVKFWAEYLLWLRNTLKLPVLYNSKVSGIYWDEVESCFVLPYGKEEKLYARKIVLATGVQGSGKWIIPEEVRRVPKQFWNMVYDNPNFEALKGKRVGILGAGSSAFDAAKTSIDHGAEEVHIFCRRPTLVNRHFFIWGKSMGFLDTFAKFPDAQKWKFVWKMFDLGHMPDPGVVATVRQSSNVTIHFNQILKNISYDSNSLYLEMPEQIHNLDYLLIAIGWEIDLASRAELSKIYSHIATWKDFYEPPSQMQNNYLLKMPYLGANFEFCEKEEGAAPYLT